MFKPKGVPEYFEEEFKNINVLLQRNLDFFSQKKKEKPQLSNFKKYDKFLVVKNLNVETRIEDKIKIYLLYEKEKNLIPLKSVSNKNHLENYIPKTGKYSYDDRYHWRCDLENLLVSRKDGSVKRQPQFIGDLLCEGELMKAMTKLYDYYFE